MSSTIMKRLLPLVFLVSLAILPAAFASGHGESASHGAAVAEESHSSVHSEAAAHSATPAGHETGAATHAAAGEHGDAHAGAAHGGGHSAPMVTPAKLKDLFWRTVNFIALVIILVKFLAKPISSGLAGRRQQIREEIESLQAKRDEAERSYKEFEARLAGMEKEMETVVEKAVAQAEAEKARILEEAERAAEDIKRQAEAAIQAEMVDARRALRDEVAEQAAAMAEELIVKNLTPEDQVAITEQYLERVGAVQ